MVDWPLVLGGVGAIVPGLLIMMWAYAPYDGHFKDNVLFLFFMGGLFAGMGLALFECLLILPICAGAGVVDPLFVVPMVLLGFPLMEQLLKLLVLNRKPHQGERTTIFYGGAFGLGFAVMMALFKSQREVPLFAYRELGAVAADPGRLLAFLAVAVAVLLAHFATGLVVGDGVRTRRLASSLGVAIAALAPLQFLTFEYGAGVRAGREAEGFIYLPLMLAYAGGLAWWAQARLLPLALPPDAQRKRRRLARKALRDDGEP